MKKLFYVVEKKLQDIDGFEETTGMKNITTYSIVNNDLVKQFDVNCTNEDNTIEAINDYLIDNGMGDSNFNLIEL